MYTPLVGFDKSSLNSTEAYIHRAAQFLAMVGKNYLDDQPDDSNANLGFDPTTSSIVGRDLSGFSLHLNVKEWNLETRVSGNTDQTIKVASQTKNSLFDWLQKQLSVNGFDPDKLNFITHYEVPDHEVDRGVPFPELDPAHVDTWLKMRSNAMWILAGLNEVVGLESDIRIWPHHFDTGTYYSLKDQRAIGAGWAIEDSLCDNPYLYIYGWSGDTSLNYEQVPGLGVGRWLITEGWQGAIVESEELSGRDNQTEALQSFMEEVSTFFKGQLI